MYTYHFFSLKRDFFLFLALLALGDEGGGGKHTVHLTLMPLLLVKI